MAIYAGSGGGSALPHQLTIRYDAVLAREIEGLARREGISRNQAAVRLLRKGARLEEPDQGLDAVVNSEYLSETDKELYGKLDTADKKKQVSSATLMTVQQCLTASGYLLLFIAALQMPK